MNQNRPIQRYEIKYLLEHNAVPALRSRLLQYMKPDPHMAGGDGYFNHSIYFDNHHFHFYLEKHEGFLSRIKPRLRAYRLSPTSQPTAYFLEFKNRADRTVFKERTRVSRELARRLLKPSSLEFTSEIECSAVLSKFYYMEKRHGLLPQVAVLYRRSAFYSELYPGLRITFDTRLQSSWSTATDSPPPAFRYALPPNQLLLEIKFNDKIPNIVLRDIKAFELQQVTFSKYAICLECATQAGSNNLKNYFD